MQVGKRMCCYNRPFRRPQCLMLALHQRERKEAKKMPTGRRPKRVKRLAGYQQLPVETSTIRSRDAVYMCTCMLGSPSSLPFGYFRLLTLQLYSVKSV